MVQDENEPHTHNRVRLSSNQLALPAASSSSSAHAVVVGPPSPSFVPFPPDKRLHTATWLPRPKQTQQGMVSGAPSTSTSLAPSSSGMMMTTTTTVMSTATNTMSVMTRTESNTTATTTTCSDDTCGAAPLSRSSSSPSPSPSPSLSPTRSKSPSRFIQSPSTWTRTRTHSSLRTRPNIGPSSTTSTPTPTPMRPRPPSSRAAVESPTPATRQHVIDAFRLRQYELDLLNDLGCPSCGVPPGTLRVWRDGIGAKCSCCHTVFEGPKLRDCLQPVMERHAQFYDGVRDDIRRCRAEVGVLGAKIDNLKAIIERHRNAIQRPGQRPSPSTLPSELPTSSGDASAKNNDPANNNRSTGNFSSFVQVNTCNVVQHQHHPRET